MFKEILKIVPQLDNKDLDKMVRALNTRFMGVAKKFGKGLLATLTGGGVAAVALGLINKLLNPLQEVQESIERMLLKSDDLVTNAKQFGTTAGNLAKLQAFGESTGLDKESLNMLITKFQTAVAEAAADPKKETSVRKFVGDKDTAESFFNFIKGLQKLDKNQQLLVQQEVFGEKQILKMADFLQTDFDKLSVFFKGISTDKLTKSAEKIGELNDLDQTLTAVRNLKDINSKAQVINKGIITARDRQAQLELEKENKRIQSYENLSAINETMTKIMGLVEQGVAMLGGLISKIVPAINRMVDAIEKFKGSRLLRGIFGKDD